MMGNPADSGGWGAFRATIEALSLASVTEVLTHIFTYATGMSSPSPVSFFIIIAKYYALLQRQEGTL
jgi:hypothetical protein